MSDKTKMLTFSAKSLISKMTPLFKPEVVTPTVWTSPKAYHKITMAVQSCSKEVGWFGLVDVVEGGYLITDIFVPVQDVTPTQTDIKPDALAAIAMAVDDPEKLIYWGHSHVNMAVVPSFQDEQQTSEYLEYADVFIRGIYNKKGEHKVDVFDSVHQVIHECVPSYPVIAPLPEEEAEAFNKDLKDNITEYTYITKKPPHPKQRGNQNVKSLTHKGNRILKYNPFIVKRTKS